MQNFYFSPLISFVIILSLSFIIIVILSYYLFNKSILSIYSFKTKHSIIDIKNLLTKQSEYNIWWPKFNKFFMYKTYVYHICDDNFKNVRIVINIHSNSSKESWEIILKQTNDNFTNITVYQELKLLSKLDKIFKSSIFYKKDLMIFKKSLKKQLSISL